MGGTNGPGALMADYFIHITDLHLGAGDRGWGVLEQFVQEIKTLRTPPRFIVNGGDIISANLRLRTDPAEGRDQFARYARIMSPLHPPVYHVMGNHDLVRDDGTIGQADFAKTLFKQFAGPRYQRFDWGGRMCLVLDGWTVTQASAQDEPRVEPGMDPAQAEWVASQLASCPSGGTVLLLTHHSVRDAPAVWERLAPVLREDLNYMELAGCDHQNSFWQEGRWTTQVTGSFCGAWWDGACVDLSPPGYALVIMNAKEQLKRYYRGTGEALAIAAPRPGQVVGDSTQVEVLDPRSGESGAYAADLRAWPAGWIDLPVRLGGQSAAVPVFHRPHPPEQPTVEEAGQLEFEIVEPGNSPPALIWNGQPLHQFDAAAGMRIQCPIPAGRMRRWNVLEVQGEGVIRSPRLIVNQRTIEEPRIARFFNARPTWFGAGRDLTWDLSGRRLKTPWRYPESTFFFPVSPSTD